MRKAVEGTLYACVFALVFAGLLLPRQDVLARPIGKPVPASGSPVAIAAHPSLARKPVRTQPKAVDRRALPRNPAALKAAKAAAERRAVAVRAASGVRAGTVRPQAFNGLGASGISDSSATPSDSTGDIGPSNYIEMVNSQVGVYDRSLNLETQTSLAAFGGIGPFLQPPLADCMFDPQVAWDQQAGRWEYAMLDQVTAGTCAAISTNYLDFGWSLSSDPLGGWCGYGLPTIGNLNDYPKLGHDNNFITIGANQFANNGDPTKFQGAILYAVSKPANGSGICPASPAITSFTGLVNGDGSPAMTLVPADTTDTSALGYIVAAEDPGSSTASKVAVWHLVSNAGTPNLFQDLDITVPAYSVPPSVPQPSTGAQACASAGNCLDSLDARLTQAVAHFDPAVGAETVWTQHAVVDANVGALSIERWYELTPGQGAPRQTGTISDPSLYVFDGAVSPTTAGNEAVIFYNTANSTPSGFVAYKAQRRTSTTPLGAMANEVVVANSTTSDADFSCGINLPATPGAPCRWGDYSAARPDPTNANAVWGTGMLVSLFSGSNTTSGWTTEVARVTPGCLSAGVSGQSVAQRGDLVLLTATSTDCSSPQYEFWLRNPNGSWSIKQGFSATNTWTWDSVGYSFGTTGQFYPVIVWVTQAGDTQSTWDTYASGGLTLMPPKPCNLAILGGAPPGSIAAGTQVPFTGSVNANHCSTPVYQYWTQAPGGPWTIARPFNTNPDWTWDTTGAVPGSNRVVMWANQRGDATSMFEGYAQASVSITGACANLTATPSPASPQAAGTPVSIGAVVTGCANPVYQFWMLAPGGTWKDVQPYSSTASFNWSTAGMLGGTYTFSLWARDAASGGVSGNSLGRWDAYQVLTYTLSATPCGSVTATSSPPATATVGTLVTITATGSGCPAPRYQFWILAPGSSTWQKVQAYGSLTTFSWATAGKAKGVYQLSIWVRDASSSGTAGNSLGRWDAVAPMLQYTLR